MKRVKDYYVPSVSEIRKAIQHYNRLNNARVNFSGDGCYRFKWYSLYWDFVECHFIWHEAVDQYSRPVGQYIMQIIPDDSPDFIRDCLIRYIYDWL